HGKVSAVRQPVDQCIDPAVRQRQEHVELPARLFGQRRPQAELEYLTRHDRFALWPEPDHVRPISHHGLTSSPVERVDPRRCCSVCLSVSLRSAPINVFAPRANAAVAAIYATTRTDSAIVVVRAAICGLPIATDSV